MLDQSSYIIKLSNFYVGYVQYCTLIILDQIWNNFVTDWPLNSRSKTNGPKINAKNAKKCIAVKKMIKVQYLFIIYYLLFNSFLKLKLIEQIYQINNNFIKTKKKTRELRLDYLKNSESYHKNQNFWYKHVNFFIWALLLIFFYLSLWLDWAFYFRSQNSKQLWTGRLIFSSVNISYQQKLTVHVWVNFELNLVCEPISNELGPVWVWFELISN